jgi:hypothetical protein
LFLDLWYQHGTKSTWLQIPWQAFPFFTSLPIKKGQGSNGNKIPPIVAPAVGGEFFRIKIIDFLGVFHLLVCQRFLLGKCEEKGQRSILGAERI